VESTQIVLEDDVSVNNTLTVVGDLTVDTNTLFVDASENKVGIGTSAPSSLLHIESASVDPTLRITNKTVAAIDTGSDIEFWNNPFTGSTTNSYESGAIRVRKTNGSNNNHDHYMSFETRQNSPEGINERMRIGSDGIVTMPNQPAFSVQGSSFDSSNWYLGPTMVLSHSGYSTSTGRFTAPVAGNYMFSYTLTSSDTTAHFVRLHKNGSQVGPTTLNYYNQYASANTTLIVNLSVGDYVQASRRGSAYGVYGAVFSGHLIG